MGKYTALTPIHHDGRLYPIGEPIELDAAHAQSLLSVGAIAVEAERKPGKKAEAERKALEQAEAERIAAEAAESAAAAAAAAAADPGDSHPV